MRTTTGAGSGSGDVLGIIRGVRRRWRLRMLLRGLALTLAAGLAAFLLSAWGLEAARFSPGAVAAGRVFAWSAVGVVAILFLARPLLRRVSDRQVALYIEEHEPSLEASILGAVEAGERPAGAAPSPELVERLVERAVERARDVDFGRRIDQDHLYRYSGVLAGLALLAVVLGVMAPQGIRHGLGALLRPTTEAASVNPYAVAVEPGDVTVARGSDLFVRARLSGFESEEVFLFTRAPGAGTPRRLSMIPVGDGEPGHEILLLDLREDTEYFVEADGVRSPTYTLEVEELPYVERMDHLYRYPAYTGLADRVMEDGGDIVALAGTEVDVVVHPTIPTPAGRIVLEGEEPVDLVPDADGALAGTLPVERRGFYRIELQHRADDGRATWVEASPRYTVDVLRDLAPGVSVVEPGRDTRASAIEEVWIEARADDDYGIDDLRLVYSVNGQAADTVPLFDAGPGAPMREVTAGHTLFLEEFPLADGDVVSYFVEARDLRSGRPGEWVTSDIYFLQIRPFRRDFREREQQGGGAPQGGGEAGAETALSELQRQVVVATFNLVRDREEYARDAFAENVTSVALAQGRVREQVSTLTERMRNRGLADAEEQFRLIAELLPEAVEAMEESEARLRAGEPGEALQPQQRALRILQKAEETYERYVGMQEPGGGGGGGGGGADASDLADLFELELDKLRNQYETVQRGERREQAAEVDELLEKLEELSRRQLQEMERQRRRAAARRNSAGGGGSEGQRSLAEETEEAARRLERLARETGDREMEESARRLREAAESMRRSAAESGSSGGAAEAGRAAERLDEAERRLRRSREERLGEEAREALDRAERLARDQEEVMEALERLPADGRARTEALDRIEERKDRMQRETSDLERQLDRMARDARQDDAATARELAEAADSIRGRDLERKIAWSKGVVRERDDAFARRFEEQIARDIDAVRRELEEAARAARGLAEDRSARGALDRARELVRSAESLDRRLDRRGEAEESGERGSQPGEGGDPQESAQESGQESGERGGGAPGEASGEPGGAAESTEGPPAGGATRGSPTPFTPEEIRQLRRAFEEQAGDARELRRELGEAGLDVEELDRSIDLMRELARAETYGDLDAVRRLREELRGSLKRVEFTLRREVEGTERGPTGLAGSAVDVPPAFRELVEEYYRELARSGGEGGR